MTSRTLIERVAVALTSDDLRLRESACDLDKIIASGWSARQRQLGALAFWAKYTMDPHKTRQFLEIVRKMSVAKARQRNRGGSQDELHLLAEAVVFWWLTDKCPTCQGRGFMVLKDQQTVSSLECQNCGGTGMRPTPKPKDAGLAWDEVKFEHRFNEVLAVVESATSAFIGNTVRSLRPPEAEAITSMKSGKNAG